MASEKSGHICVEVKPMRAAIKDVVGAIEGRNTIPILSNLLIRAAPGMATLCGTDLDVLVERHLDLEEAGQNVGFTTTVEAKLLAGIFAKLPADAVADVLLEDGKMLVKAGRARFALPTLPADDFPVIPAKGLSHSFEMDGAQLDALFDAVAFAQSTEETRYYLNGIFLHAPEEALIAVATDGHRLGRAHQDAPEGAAGLGDGQVRSSLSGAIVSRKTVRILGGLLDGHSAPVTVSIGAGKMQVEIGQSTLTAKLIDGTFPDYLRVIPAANPHAAWFDPRALTEAVERVTTISSEKTRTVACSFVAGAGGEGTLTLDVASPEHGTASETLAVRYDGPEIRIGFNGGFLLAMLAKLTGESAQVILKDDTAPSLWRDAEEARRDYVIMPMRV